MHGSLRLFSLECSRIVLLLRAASGRDGESSHDRNDVRAILLDLDLPASKCHKLSYSYATFPPECVRPKHDVAMLIYAPSELRS